MSRETNSTLLRYGINSFWSNSTSSPRFLFKTKQLESFFNIFLINYHLYPLKIQYKINLVHVYVFFYKEEKLSFLQKYMNLKKLVLNKLLLRKKYNLNTKKKNYHKNKNFYFSFMIFN